jgi:AcrR family transcriptional regulator
MESHPQHRHHGTPGEAPDTRTRLLDAAERLFAEHGIAATSVRQITAEADANIAAVNYHFGSKAGLIEDVYARRIRPLNEERIRRLHEVEAAAAGGAPSLEGILAAFLAPVAELGREPQRGGPPFLQLMARAAMEPTDETHRLVFPQFMETGLQFFRALQRALPHLGTPVIFARFRFMLGAMFFTFANVLDPGMVAECGPAGLSGLTTGRGESPLDDLVAFLAAGFRAPAPEDA